MPLIDVHSSIEALTLQPKTGLGMPCFVFKTATADTNIYEEFRTIKQFKEAATMTTVKDEVVLNQKLDYVFSQDSRHEKFAVLITSDITTGLEQFKDKDFYFILSADDVTANKLEIAKYVNSAVNTRIRMAILQSATVTEGKSYNLLKNVISLYSPVANEQFDAAAVANIGSQPVGSITWKFKKVRGITVQYLTEEDMLEIDDARMIAYAYKHGAPQTTEGWTAYVTADDVIPQYIDDIHGQAWVRFDVEKRIALTLQNEPKLPYDNRGIKVLEGCATTTLQEASSMGIVGVNEDNQYVYAVAALTREQQDPQDIVTRKYRGLTYTYRKSGAIHEVWVSGTVEF